MGLKFKLQLLLLPLRLLPFTFKLLLTRCGISRNNMLASLPS